MFWAFVACLISGSVSFATGIMLSKCGICCPPNPNTNESRDQSIDQSRDQFNNQSKTTNNPDAFQPSAPSINSYGTSSYIDSRFSVNENLPFHHEREPGRL